MDLTVEQGDLTQYEADCLIVNAFEGIAEPGGATRAVDMALNGDITRLLASGDFSGKQGTSALLYTGGRLQAPRVLVVGLGKAEEFDVHGVRRAAAQAIRELSKLEGVRTCGSVLHGAGAGNLEPLQAAQAFAEGALLAAYRSPQYRRKDTEARPEHCTIVEFNAEIIEQVLAGVDRGAAIAQGVSTARDLVSEPPNVLTPVELARRARAMADQVGLKCTVLGEASMRELGMNILLAVSQGSANEAQFIILEHAPAGHEDEPPLVFAGKGITFDTGGISIKPSNEMWRMKSDMGGAAAVIGSMEAIARLNTPRRVIGVAPCVENMPGGKAYRPGDIITGMTGKTAEIISTDAEGRLVLADALAYAARFEPAAVVDLATLTGAIGIALGKNMRAGLFANDQKLQEALMGASERSGDLLWPMPMDDGYMEPIKSDMAEVKNSGGRFGGVSTSAKFLEHFTEGYPWAHLDIANMVWTDSNNAPETPKGATGFGVRLLVELASGM